MASYSFLAPRPTNTILSDVDHIREIQWILAQLNPSLADDAPEDSKRLVPLDSAKTQYRFERLVDSSWKSVGKLMHDVDTLDGCHASTSAVKNTIPVYNADAKLVGDLTGNANTATTLKNVRKFQIGGIASGGFVNFDGSADVTIEITQLTVTNANDTAINGILTVKHGGTGGNDAATARANLGVPAINHASADKSFGVATTSVYGHAIGSDTINDTFTADKGYFFSPKGAHDLKLLIDGKAPIKHASTTTEYGLGTKTEFGHTKLSDATDSALDVDGGTAATPKAVKDVADNAAASLQSVATSLQSAVTDLENQIADFEAFPDQTDAEGQSLVSVGGKPVWWPMAQNILDAAEAATQGSEGGSDIYEPLISTVAHEMGSWWISLDNSIPIGGLPHLGHLCSRATYGDFWTWCELNKTVVSDEEWLAYADSHNGCCPYYSYGDGSTTFRTPKYDQSFLKVLATIGGTGEMEEAGLPNITGRFEKPAGASIALLAANIQGTGAFSGSERRTSNSTASAGSATEVKVIDFNAANSNSIYGNSDTVTPQNFGIIVGVYAVGAVSAPIGETDAANLLNGLTTLESNVGALQNGSGFNAAGKAEIVGWGMPDYSAGITFTASKTEASFTAPSNGVVTVDLSGFNSDYCYLKINGQTMFKKTSNGNNWLASAAGEYQVNKGDVVTYKDGYSTNGGANFSATTSVVFYPLKGV